MPSPPRLWIVAGPNGAGKTTVAGHRIAAMMPVVNPDAIAATLGDPSDRTVQIAAGRRAVVERAVLLQARRSFAIETTLSGSSTLNLMERAAGKGYEVRLLFIGLSDDALAMQRVADRVGGGGHRVPTVDVRRRYGESLFNLPAAMRLANRTFILDNSRLRWRRLMVIRNGRELFRSDDLPEWLREAGVLADLRRHALFETLRP